MESNIWYPYDGHPRLGARCAVMYVHHKRRATTPVAGDDRPEGPVSGSLGASSTLDDAKASSARARLPRKPETGSYGYHMLDSIH